MKRRSLLGAILAAGFAPAAVGSGILMPVRRPILEWGVIESFTTHVSPLLLEPHVVGVDFARGQDYPGYIVVMHPDAPRRVREQLEAAGYQVVIQRHIPPFRPPRRSAC